MLNRFIIFLGFLGALSSAQGADFPTVDGEEYCGLVNVHETPIPGTADTRKSVGFIIPPPPPTSHTYPELILLDRQSEKYMLELIAQGKYAEYEGLYDYRYRAFSLSTVSLEIAQKLNSLTSGNKVCLRGLSTITGYQPPNVELWLPAKTFYGIQVIEINVVN